MSIYYGPVEKCPYIKGGKDYADNPYLGASIGIHLKNEPLPELTELQKHNLNCAIRKAHSEIKRFCYFGNYETDLGVNLETYPHLHKYFTNLGFIVTAKRSVGFSGSIYNSVYFHWDEPREATEKPLKDVLSFLLPKRLNAMEAYSLAKKHPKKVNKF